MTRFIRLVASVVILGFCSLCLGQNPNVTLTGVLQGPNGLPAANQIIAFTPTQTFFVAGLGSNGCNSYLIQINGTSLTCADTINFNNTTPAAPTNGVNVTWQKSTSGTTDSVSAALVGDGNANHCLLGNGTFGACPVSGGNLPGSPLIGDIIRYNLNGDSAWDAVSYAQPFSGVFTIQGTPTPNGAGVFWQNGLTTTGSAQNFPATATQGGAITYSSAGTASLNTLIGARIGNNGNNSIGPFLAFYRSSFKLQLNVLASVRYWIGLGCWNNGSALGNNGTQILATTAYAADTPNKTTIGFRFSAGTDTHWQAVTAVAGGSQTTVDTGITPDTNVHLFEFAPNSTGTAITFFIDGASVATISTNLPPMGLASDSMATQFWTGDNKNTNTSVSANFYWMTWALK